MAAATTAATTLAGEIDAVMGDVVGYDGAAITGLGADGVIVVPLTYSFGRRAAAKHAYPPNVRWTFGSGAGGAALKTAFPGGRRALLTRLPQLRAACWGSSPDAASELASAVLAAMQRRYGGRVVYQGEDWEADGAVTDLGDVVTLAWQFPIAVLDRAPTRATVTSTTPDASVATQGDGQMHLGENS